MRPALKRADRLNPHTVLPSVYDLQFLLQQCRWIRDDLDPQIAREGPDILHSDDVLNLDELLRKLLISNISREDIRFSRLHLALLCITGKATRWPKKIIEKADNLRAVWETQHGPMKDLGTPLYESGGRLHDVCKAEEQNNDRLIVRWLKSTGIKLSPLAARKVGDLGFKPGDWWISPVFAFKDGIIDSASHSAPITADKIGAYAILMVGDEESDSTSPTAFTYRTRDDDIGRYRLTSATRDSRQPVRVLRGHTLRSFWAPNAGVRYDGLHRVAGWSIAPDTKTRKIVYNVKFERLPSEAPMDIVLRRPYSDETEDYKEFKRLRQSVRDESEETAQAAVNRSIIVLTPEHDQSAYGTVDSVLGD